MNTLSTWLPMIVWSGFIGYWLVAARHARKTVRRATGPAQTVHIALVMGSLVLMAMPLQLLGLPTHRMVAVAEALWIGLLLCVIGMSFAGWARYWLGQYWAGAVALKEDHRLIQGGPYAIVRHPIYTGVLAAALGTALMAGDLRSFVLFAVVAGCYLVKIRREERWLLDAFGDEYTQYQARTAALIPKVY
ncbi:isoprenylcysteine carboxylmethyltransferase family protein [Burkholderia humptydooensis]|uniref:Isoprenylcysteine carboxylmethyltransferase family protein n=2 Tax=Burkholderia humptydooensis TaxID=430531 RepID=A0A7T2X104_9BURK|nr:MULTISPECIES: isoprenylcysteine carboxylmethyltransferase family protein [Burkholderia]AJY38417.1 isoprenylcysteine carboxyl methyltransferase family protein [Burkholderia sp. 2002721687]QPS47861.1 isoprenylcysteine carboxylmethyltransferase family protein [Burkholderia humptydooensis]